MAHKFKALLFDLGGVLLEWDRHSVDALSPGQFLTIMNSTTWHSLDRGIITLEEAYKVMPFVPLGRELHERQLRHERNLAMYFVQIRPLLKPLWIRHSFR